MSPSVDRRRVGVMGGTFDPIHHGHLVAASEVQHWFDLDEVVFVPTGDPWQKADRDVTGAEHRYLMTVIATASNPRFTVSRVDIDRPGRTYTVDTLRDLRAAMPDAELYFITGADALAEIPALAISSTDCRRRGERGEPVWYLVPDGVVQYLTKHDLYPPAHDAGEPGPTGAA